MLATTGWTAVAATDAHAAPGRRSAAWQHGRSGGRALPDPASPRPAWPASSPRSPPASATGWPALPAGRGQPERRAGGLRYRANRVAPAQAREAEPGAHARRPALPDGRTRRPARMHRYDALAQTGPPDPRLRPRGSGRVAEVFGDLDTARRVSVVVPGVDTDLLTFQRTNRTYSAPVGMAHALYRADGRRTPRSVRPSSPGPTTPRPPGSAWTRRPACSPNSGALRLNALVGALPGPPEGRAVLPQLRLGAVRGRRTRAAARVTDIAVAGSPGMRVENAAPGCAPAPGCGRCGTPTTGSGRTAPGGRRARPRRRPGLPGLRRAGPLRRGARARRLLRAGYASLDNFAEIGVGAYDAVRLA